MRALGTLSNPPWVLLDLHTDHLGTVRVITDDWGAIVSKHDYFPFGEPVVKVLPGYNTHEFTGHERDAESGMDYMLARYYGAGVGRFLSVDPITTIGKNVPSPQRWNRYVYSGNNPIRYFDPDGREYTQVDNRFAAGIQGIRASGSSTGNSTLDKFAKNTSNPSEGKVSDGAAWGVRNADGKDVGRIYKADASKPSGQEITAAGGVKAVLRAGESIPAQKDAQGNVTQEGVTVVYLGAKQHDPAAAGMTDQQFIEKEIVHETVEQNGEGDDAADTAESSYVKETQKAEPQQEKQP